MSPDEEAQKYHSLYVHAEWERRGELGCRWLSNGLPQPRLARLSGPR